MSLILEALRKSEAERRRGQAPDLMADTAPLVPPRHAQPRDVRTLVIAAATAVVALALLALWWRMGAASAPAATMPTASGDTAGADVDAAPRGAAPTPAPLQPPRWQPQVRTVPARVQRAPAGVVSATPPPAEPAARPMPAQPVARREVAAPAPGIPADPPPATAVAAPAAPVFSSPDLPLRLSDLSSEERQQLPPLKLSMHMWGDGPGNRFAIIDGTRVSEGDRVGEAMVDAIERDAVVLAWRGRRIRLPIR